MQWIFKVFYVIVISNNNNISGQYLTLSFDVMFTFGSPSVHQELRLNTSSVCEPSTASVKDSRSTRQWSPDRSQVGTLWILTLYLFKYEPQK